MRLSPRLPTLLSALLIFYPLYRLLSAATHDPTSVFFSPSKGYAPSYSLHRRAQALDHITHFSSPDDDDAPPAPKVAPDRAKICVGIPSAARQGGGYLRETVGSLLAGLSPLERSEMYVVVLIPHSEPGVHAAYGEAWLHALVDKVLTYEDLAADELQRVRTLEEEDGPEFLEKGLYDYRYLLLHCAKQHTPYIAVFEDDVVAMDGWAHRMMTGVLEAEAQSTARYKSREFLYLRLFYTEEFLGWNTESWKKYLGWSVACFFVPMLTLGLLRERYPKLKSRGLTNRVVGVFAALIVTSIALFFALGRITVNPLAPGVSLMQQYGCCSQGLVFTRGRALMLATYFADRQKGGVDVIIEDYANERGELRWAVTPSVLQHIGRKSSKMDDYGDQSKYGMSVAEKIWSFGFERLDWKALEEEHAAITEIRGDGSLVHE